MAGYRYPKENELLPSQAELDAAKKAQQAQQSKAIGGGVGSVAGAALGALGLFGGPELAAATIPLGASLGGAAGDAVGGAIGDAEAQRQNEIVNAAEMERQKKLAAFKLRQDALARLESTG